MSNDYLAKAAEKIDQWEQACNARGLLRSEAERIARAWIQLAAIERGVTPAPANPEET